MGMVQNLGEIWGSVFMVNSLAEFLNEFSWNSHNSPEVSSSFHDYLGHHKQYAKYVGNLLYQQLLRMAIEGPLDKIWPKTAGLKRSRGVTVMNGDLSEPPRESGANSALFATSCPADVGGNCQAVWFGGSGHWSRRSGHPICQVAHIWGLCKMNMTNSARDS